MANSYRTAVSPLDAGAVLSVCPSGCAYAHIQDAINAAASGDTISVAAGTYTETVTIPLSVTLAGAGAGNTIIDGNKSGTVVTVNAGATVVITGVTIQDGSNGISARHATADQQHRLRQ